MLLNKSILVFDRLQFKLRTSDGLLPSKEIRYLSSDSFISLKRSFHSLTKLSDDVCFHCSFIRFKLLLKHG